tara:strand:+ start:1790 stop:2854 length:1065 start_codon:yes stop_codon:yes gene_type:complete
MQNKKVLIVQRVVAHYRKPFFNKLSEVSNLTVVSGKSMGTEDVIEEGKSNYSNIILKVNYYLNSSFWWHSGILKALKKEKPDVVIISPTPRCLTNFIIAIYCKLKNIKLIGWGLGQIPGRTSAENLLHSIAQKTIIIFLNNLITYSTKAYDYYKNLGFNGKIYTAFNAVCTKNFLPKTEFIYHPGLKIVYVGRVTPEKRLDELIKIVMRNKNFYLTVIGPNSKYLAEKFSSKEIKERISFLDFLADQALNKELIKNDIFVLPSRGGLAINHAMASGLPVIVSEGDGTELDLIDHGIEGFLFKNEDWISLEKILCKVSKDKKLLEKMGKNATSKIKGQFTIDEMCKTFLKAINQK